MDQLVQKLRDWWESADRTTRAVTIVGSVLFVAVVFFTFSLSTQTKMAPVISGMNDAEKGQVYDELVKKGVKVELSPQGEVVVPLKDVARAKMLLAQANKLPKGGSNGFGLDKIGAFDTPNVEREKLLKSLESELATSVQTIDGVAAATVHIAPGKDSAVLDEKVSPTAVVSLTENASGSVNKAAGKSIANLIQSAVTGLESKGVKVISNSGRMLYDGSEESGDSAIASSKLETERQRSREMTVELQQQLDTAFGKGATIATVQASYNMDPTTTQSHKEVPSESPVVREIGTEKLSASTPGAAGGVAGAEANTPANPAARAAGETEGKKYDNKGVSEKFAVSTVNTTLVKAPELAGLNITVLVDKKRVKKVADLKKFVDGRLGGKAGEAGFQATVVPTEFSTADSEMAKKASDDASTQQKLQSLMALLPVLALVAVGVILARALTKLAPVQPKLVAATAAAADPMALGSMFGTPGFGPTTIEHRGLGDYTPPGWGSNEPHVVEHRFVDERTGATALAEHDAPAEPKESYEEREARETAEVMRALGIDDDDDIDVEAIKGRINVPLEKIKKMVDRKPEMTAMLIKGWLLEDHR